MRPFAVRRSRAFTLVEIMIVVLIVALLAALATFVIKRIQHRALLSMIENNLRQAYQAKEFYFSDTGDGMAVGFMKLAQQNYLKERVGRQMLAGDSYEAHQGWHYYRLLLPDQPVLAYRGATPNANSRPQDLIWYPGPPADVAAYFSHNTVTGSTGTPQPPTTQPPAVTTTQPPPVHTGSTVPPTTPQITTTATTTPPANTPQTTTPAVTTQPTVTPPATTSGGTTTPPAQQNPPKPTQSGPGNSDFGHSHHSQGKGKG